MSCRNSALPDNTRASRVAAWVGWSWRYGSRERTVQMLPFHRKKCKFAMDHTATGITSDCAIWSYKDKLSASWGLNAAVKRLRGPWKAVPSKNTHKCKILQKVCRNKILRNSLCCHFFKKKSMYIDSTKIHENACYKIFYMNFPFLHPK